MFFYPQPSAVILAIFDGAYACSQLVRDNREKTRLHLWTMNYGYLCLRQLVSQFTIQPDFYSEQNDAWIVDFTCLFYNISSPMFSWILYIVTI